MSFLYPNKVDIVIPWGFSTKRGEDALKKSKVEKAALCGLYQELLDLVGYEHMMILYEYYHGQQVNFPARIYDKEYLLLYLKEHYASTNIKTLSRQLGYSERWIRKLIRKIESEEACPIS